MDRRTAMISTLLLGGLIPRSLLAQNPSRRTASNGRARSTSASDPPRSRRASTEEPEAAAADPADPLGEGDTPPNFPAEPGQQWRSYDITRYTGLAHSQSAPQNALIEWIFRRTGSASWHGDKIAVLAASRSQVRAYHNAKILEQVGEVVERFTNATNDFLSIRVRFVAAVDTSWRYTVYSRLNLLGSGPQGQQIWTLKLEDSAFVLAQMQVRQGFRLLADQKVEMVNGQTLSIKTSEPRGFVGGMQRESAVGLGFQPRADQLEEGITLRLSPLLTFDGDTLDAAIELTANTVKDFLRTKVIAPREIGPSEMSIDVPEVVESRLNQTVKSWPIGQTLLISAGIQPGILGPKNGFMNLRIPGTTPSGTELLVFLDAETVSRGRK